ncbi:4'-phosphopantetheinyl transferase family protein [Bacteroidota bacterium]
MAYSRAAVPNRLENFPVLSPGEIHAWRVSTTITPATFAQYKNALTETELSQVPFFEFEKSRDSYIVSQGALRMLVSGYLGIPQNLVRLGRKKKGKPYSIDDPGLYFNMSNSGKTAVIAFSLDSEVGIDIEQIRHLPDLDELITRNFTTSEIKFINAKPEERIRRFFRFWTLKESYLKAIGEGMRLTPDNLEFAIENNRIRLLSVKGIFEQEDWKFKEFSTSTDYVGAITYNNDDTVLKFMEFK